MLVLTLQTLLQSRLFRNEDVDFQILIAIGWLGCFLLALALTFFIAISLLVDQTFSGEKVGDKATLFHHILRDRPDNTDHTREQTLNRVVLEQNVTCEKLSQDATQRPYVNLVIIAASKYDFGCPIRAGLNVGAEMIMNETTATKVNDLDLTSRV